MQINVVSINPLPSTQKKRLQTLGDVKYFDTTLGDPQLPGKIAGAEILMISPRLHIDILPLLDRCKMIAVQGTGYDSIDTGKARDMGIAVYNVPAYGPESVAEHNFALMLAVARRVTEGDKIIRRDEWKTGLAYYSAPLKGQTLGIFGFGLNAKLTAKIAHGFGMEVISTTAHPNKERAKKHNVKFVEFDELLKESDFIVLAAPATTETTNRFSANEFKTMKKTAIFINTARGALVDEQALSDALNTDEIAGAGIDVYKQEPPQKDNPLLAAKNCIFTPHTAWSSQNAVNRLNDICIDNIEKFLQGNSQNIVN